MEISPRCSNGVPKFGNALIDRPRSPLGERSSGNTVNRQTREHRGLIGNTVTGTPWREVGSHAW